MPGGSRRRMHSTITLAFWLTLIAGSLSLSSNAMALELRPAVGASLEYTNNAGLTPDNEDDDWITRGYVGGSLSEKTGPLKADATTSLTYEHYINNTFGNKYYFDLAANSTWEMIRNRLNWQVRDYYTQTPVDSFNADTPANTQNTNVFSIGPQIQLPVTGRQTISVNPLFQDYYYGDDDIDNRQYGLNANWLYRLYPHVNTGVEGRVTRVKYDNDDKYPEYTISTFNGVISGERVYTQSQETLFNYTLKLGGTTIRRDRSEDESGPVGSLTWLYRLTGHSAVRLFTASELTDTSSSYYDSQVNPQNGDFSNIQSSGDVLRENTVRLSYERQGSRLTANVGIEYRDLDYKVAPDDRKVKAIGSGLNYRVLPMVTTGVYGSFNQTKGTNDNRRDDRYILGGNLSYRLSRKLSTVFNLQYQNKDSTEAIEKYSEFRAFVSLVYGYGSQALPGPMDTGY